VTINHILCDEKHKDKLYDNERLDPRKSIKDGPVCDISKVQGTTNIPPNLSTFFVTRSSNPLSALINLLARIDIDSLTNIEINVYGQKGVGKSRIVEEAAEFLRQRNYFDQGIFKIDLLNVTDFEQVHEILQIKKQNEIKEKQKNESLLIIFDNCDQFINKNKTSF
jgi:hypothetical protein